MARLGGERGPGPALDRQTLRIAGLVTVACSAAVTAASFGTPYGLSVPGQSGSTTATVLAEVGVPTALVAFAAAHPAYPAVTLVGLLMIVAGEDTPLIGS